MANNWRNLHLAEVLDLIQNGLNGLQVDQPVGYPISRIETIQNSRFDENRIKYIEVDKEAFAKYHYQVGDLAFSHINSFEKVGKVALYNGEIPNLLHGVNLLRFKFKSGISPRFAFYYFNSTICRKLYEPYINKAINQASINQKNLSQINFPLPRLSEQHRIVAKLDSLFERTDKAIALIEQNIAKAKHLMASVLNDWFDQSEMATFVYDDLQRDNLIGLVRNTHQQGLNLPYKYVKMNNITSSGSLNMFNYTCINASENEVSRFSLQKGDFLFNTRNSYELVGKTCVFDSDEKQVTFNNNILRTRFKNNINPYYIGFQFKSEFVKNQLTSLKSGTTNVSAIYYKGLAKLKLRVPEISEQNRAVRFLSKMKVQQENYIVKLENQKTQLLELKSSLLDAAFKGEL